MQSMQRQFGKLRNKGPGDNAKVSALLSDYDDADNVLAKIIEDAKMWSESWASLVTCQLQAVSEYEGLYDPIVGASSGRQQGAATPQLQLERTFRLKEAYSELKVELMEEITLIEGHILQPASDARDAIAPIRKTIKKRENKRLDYEMAQEKALKLQRKPCRTAKEDAALAKAAAEMSRTADEFSVADDHLRETLPPIITAAFNLVSPLVANLILIQNRLLGLYYTTLHNYCEEFGFPSPPPPMQDVISTWNAAFGPARSKVESISFIARGKAAQQPISAPKDSARSTSSSLLTGIQARTLRIKSGASSQTAEDNTPPALSYQRPDYSNATDFTAATILGGGAVNRSNGTSPNMTLGKQQDYFNKPGTASTASQVAASALAAKKKKPPPPPPKRAPTATPDEWVVAQFAFAGEGQGDLSFQEGDRIKIVRKTNTDQDWWVGELRGRTGNFPANYCRKSL